MFSAAPVAAAVGIMPLGDSITAGAYPWGKATGGYRLRLYQDLTAAGVPFRFVGSQVDASSGPLVAVGKIHYEGHPGFRADQIASNLLDADDSHTGNNGGHWLDGAGPRPAAYPDVVLLEAGTNDVLERDSLAAVVAHLDRLIGILTAARPKVDVLVGSLLPIDEPQALPEVKAADELIRVSIVPKYQRLGRRVMFVDQYRNFVDAQGRVISLLLYDHVHPVAAGYTMMADTWASAITLVERSSFPLKQATQ